MKKSDIVNLLNRKYGYRRLLEISTPTTGRKFGEFDRSILTSADRLIYRCPDTYHDGASISFRTTHAHSYEIIRTLIFLRSERVQFDTIFVDPYHLYQDSALDIAGAFALLQDDGMIVVHDCNPPTIALASAEAKPRVWSGVTYAAFIDFVMLRSDLTYYTVDCDLGCGVIFKHPPESHAEKSHYETMARHAFEWEIHRHDDTLRYQFFSRHRKNLLNLISVDQFLEQEGLSQPEAGLAVPDWTPPRGYVDYLGPSSVRGWVMDVQNPDARLTVAIEVAGLLVATVVADAFRADLAAAGFGDGAYGFDVTLPQTGPTDDDALRCVVPELMFIIPIWEKANRALY